MQGNGNNVISIGEKTNAGEPEANWGHLSIEERNAYVLGHLWCIDRVIRQNDVLVEAARLDRDDVYQALAVRLIRAVELYRPGRKSLESYISMHLKYELLSCKSAKAVYGFCGAPYDLRNAAVSIEALKEADPHWDIADIACAA